MKPCFRACSAVVLFLLTSLCGSAYAANDIVLLYKGDAVANTHPPPAIGAFDDWCHNNCAPSVNLPVYDARTGRLEGEIFVWTHPFTPSADGSSFCFSEFIVFVLDAGTLYTASHPLGVCGGRIDPSLKQAVHAPAPAVVVAGGGDGVIVGGTKKFRRWKGTYTDRVFVELTSALGGANYYDQLFFAISRDEQSSFARGEETAREEGTED